MKLLDKTSVYKDQERILVAVDCVLFGFDSNRLNLLLFRRKVEPLKGSWSLIGAFIKDDLSLGDAAKDILFKTTGLKDIYLDELQTYSKVDRDPGDRVISVAFYSLIRIDEFDMQFVENHDAHWFGYDEIPELILDHNQMVQDALAKLRRRAMIQPLVFELLPEKFTILQLQSIYECIFQKRFDDRNFRKKIIAFDILTKTNEKDKSSSKKGAFLYSFDQKKFDKFLAKGYKFDF
jgi:8-oxo-dGTP diphosphatase